MKYVCGPVLPPEVFAGPPEPPPPPPDAMAALVRERQPVQEIWCGEKVAPWLK